MALLSSTGTRWLTVLVSLALVAASLSFLLTPASGESLRPVDFADTVDMGGTGVDARRADDEGFVLPQVEVFYSGYRYVVGYVGIETAVSELGDASAQRQFGDPLAVYVSDFSTIEPNLTEEGFVVPERGRSVGWTPADTAFYVVDSDAAIPSGPVTVAFSERADAERFAAAHGGEVVDWEALRSRVGDPLPAKLDGFEASVDDRHAWANDTVTAAEERGQRPVSVVVGVDPGSVSERAAADGSAPVEVPADVASEPTVSAALDAAPPNTTVYLPPGTYEVDRLVVNRSITLAGAGADTILRGDGNRSVLYVRADGAAVSDLRVDGVGDVGSRGRDLRNDSGDWDTTVQLAYGYGDAGVVLDGAAGASVRDVEVDTPASGVIVRESPDSVIRNLTTRGAETARGGFMGVVLIGSPSVVQDSTFLGGRDGVYTHRADGSVVRDNDAEPGRYGVHEMYTSESLVANNTVRDAQAGVIVMTRPVDNAVVGNDVRGSTYGVVPAGSDSYYARNVIVDNEYGLQVAGDRNAFVDNVALENEVGARANDILPSNWVLRNDFLRNERAVESRIGPLRTWSHGGVGNHWGTLPIPDGDDDGVYDRPYRPTGTVDSRIGTVSGATALAQSPAVATLRRVQDAVSGLRQSGVVDTDARTEPFHPKLVDEALTEGRADRSHTGVDPTEHVTGVDTADMSTEGTRNVTAERTGNVTTGGVAP
ncbi:NosD domain-containing protein [Halobellus rarus]|uniref:NosD domain-containing protein n=1 Tax=Halobellus rarus TaxID=1126237 RepID=A0ABD6CUS7_9EURY|nr:NosD domain-containing protein [Halobellus rarus]